MAESHINSRELWESWFQSTKKKIKDEIDHQSTIETIETKDDLLTIFKIISDDIASTSEIIYKFNCPYYTEGLSNWTRSIINIRQDIDMTPAEDLEAMERLFGSLLFYAQHIRLRI